MCFKLTLKHITLFPCVMKYNLEIHLYKIKTKNTILKVYYVNSKKKKNNVDNVRNV